MSDNTQGKIEWGSSYSKSYQRDGEEEVVTTPWTEVPVEQGDN